MLNTDVNLLGADDFYAELLALHEGKSDAQSAAINARLILVVGQPYWRQRGAARRDEGCRNAGRVNRNSD